MSTVRSILEQKEDKIISVHPDDTLLDAIQVLQRTRSAL
jgi:hypothetical protein